MAYRRILPQRHADIHEGGDGVLAEVMPAACPALEIEDNSLHCMIYVVGYKCQVIYLQCDPAAVQVRMDSLSERDHKRVEVVNLKLLDRSRGRRFIARNSSFGGRVSEFNL